jgi:CheY-like chemotaxis protein
MAKKKILIIDDSADTRLAVSARLKKHGYDTAFAADALQELLTIGMRNAHVASWSPTITPSSGNDSGGVIAEACRIDAVRSQPPAGRVALVPHFLPMPVHAHPIASSVPLRHCDLDSLLPPHL